MEKTTGQAVDFSPKNDLPWENKADEAAQEAFVVKNETPATEEHTASANITLDDIAGVITTKLEHCVSTAKKKNFNEKMRNLLKTYEVPKVSALSPEQYESFLNDVAQITA